MDSTPPPTATILHADLPVAVCTIDRVFLAPAIEAMPTTHPDRVLVEAKCVIAAAYLAGDVTGPYDDRECEASARFLIGDPPEPPPTGRRLRPRRGRASKWQR